MAKTRARIEAVGDPGAMDHALHLLGSGALVAVPTETVYGLAADATNENAVQSIYRAKGRPSYNPLICHVASVEMAARFARLDATARLLCDHFWPGPLTLVLPLKPDFGLAAAVTAGLESVAVRMPASEAVRSLIARLDRPVAAPSANPSGKLSPTSAEDVATGLGDQIPLILDGGQTEIGIESTIVGLTGAAATLLRPGSVTADDIYQETGLRLLDCVPVSAKADTISAPGQLDSHYAPNAQLRLNARDKRPGEVLIGFGDISGDISLSPSGDLGEAAQNLFSLLRQADRLSPSSIAVAPIPNSGTGLAINDRLARAAAPRD